MALSPAADRAFELKVIFCVQGVMYLILGRYAEAERYAWGMLAALEKTEKEMGLQRGSGREAITLNELAELYHIQGRYADAEPLYRRALVIPEKALSYQADVYAAISLTGLGRLKSALRDWSEAYKLLSEATAIYIRRARRSGEVAEGVGDIHTSRLIGNKRLAFAGKINAAAQLVHSLPGPQREEGSKESYITAQWAYRSETGAALASMAARFAKGDGPIATLVRQRQDLLKDYQRQGKALIFAISRPTAAGDASIVKDGRERIAAIEQQIDAIDRDLKERFPEYAAIANPEPLTIGETQQHLRSDEALYQVLVDQRGGSDFFMGGDQGDRAMASPGPPGEADGGACGGPAVRPG